MSPFCTNNITKENSNHGQMQVISDLLATCIRLSFWSLMQILLSQKWINWQQKTVFENHFYLSLLYHGNGSKNCDHTALKHCYSVHQIKERRPYMWRNLESDFFHPTFADVALFQISPACITFQVDQLGDKSLNKSVES